MGRNGALFFAQYAAWTTVVAGITFLDYRLLHVNETTVALSFLLVVLVSAARGGLQLAIYLSLLSTLVFNYFFLPPIFTFTIADTRNWVALFSFLVTAVIASNLSERARKEAEKANERRREVERLYGFSQQLLITENPTGLLTRVPADLAATFGFADVALFASSRRRIYRSSGNSTDLPAERLRANAQRGDTLFEDKQTCYTPLMMGARSMGTLGISGPLPSRKTIEALASLIAIAVERAEALEKLTRTEAARESERLHAALLDSITHELRTPLTSIKAAITSVRQGPALDESQKNELFAVIEEETDRLDRLIAEAVEMSQLDAREVKLDIRPHDVREALDAAMGELAEVMAKHPVEVRFPASLPRAKMDLNYITKVLRHLLENAAKYSDAGGPIFISAETEEGRLVVNVADRGAGIDDLEQALIFDKFYRGRDQRGLVPGTGMGLAIVRSIVEAHQGKITCTSQIGHGSVFTFTLPIAY